MPIATFDFETYSEAGYVFVKSEKYIIWRKRKFRGVSTLVPLPNPIEGRWKSIVKSPPHGLGAIGAAKYAEHSSTEILSLAYNLFDGLGPRLWVPGCPNPEDLLTYILRGGILEAWNSAFEFWIWLRVCHERMGWPYLPYTQLEDAMAKARAFALPGKLEKAAKAINSMSALYAG